MSAKSSKKPTKVNLKPKEPRAMEAIEQDYGRLVSQGGQCQYQISVLTEDLKRINDELRNLNYEAAARKNLDQAAPKAEPTEEGVANAGA